LNITPPEFRLPVLVETGTYHRSELLTIPEWGGVEIEVRSMNAGDRLNYFASTILFEKVYGDQVTDWGAIMPSSVIPVVFSPVYIDGQWAPGESTRRVFRWEDWDRLAARSATALYRIHLRALELSGFSETEMKLVYQRLTSDGDFRLMFELCKELGMGIHELCRRLPSWEFTWWRAYYTLYAYEQEQSMKSHSGGSEFTGTGFT
jgi:hypothetical protein